MGEPPLEEGWNQVEGRERTSVLANERTYAAWVRTGLTSLAAGAGFERFFGDVIPHPVNRAIAITLIGCSALFFYLAAWRYHHVGTRLITYRISGAPVTLLNILSGMLLLAALALLIALYWSG